MNGELKAGDTVELNSGGPIMTVAEFPNAGIARCQWFHGPEAKWGNFPIVSLKKVKPA